MSQRTRVVTGPAMSWFLISSCAVETTGRAITATNAIHSRIRPCSSKKAAGVCAARIMSTRLPTNASSDTSISEPRKPATSSSAKAGHTGLMNQA